jgi:hypothetical protein
LRVASIVFANLASLLYRAIAQLNLSVATTWYHRSITKICRENIALTSSYCFAVSLITFISLATTSRCRSIMPVVLAKIYFNIAIGYSIASRHLFIASYHIYIARIIPIISCGCEFSLNRLFVAQHF